MKHLLSLIILFSFATATAQTDVTAPTDTAEKAEVIGTIRKTTDAEQKEAHKVIKAKKKKHKKHKSKHKKSH